MNFKLRFISAIALCALAAGSVSACPFCGDVARTLSEDISGADAVVLAKLVKEAPANADSSDPNSGMATFEIVETMKGPESLKPKTEISVVFFGDADRSKTYFVTGLGNKDKFDWTTPLPLTAAATGYVRQLPNIAAAGPARLEFFQDYLEHADPLLAQDAYDEFGRAPYAELRELKPKMKHDRIVKWVADPEVSPSRRRLYLTMLGVCGTKADVPLLEAMIVSDFDAIKPQLVGLVGTALTMGGPVGTPALIEFVQQDERRKKLGLDALVACYLILRGPEGMDVVENRFLKNPHAEYTHVYSTIMALRFHGDENTGIIPRERLLAAMRLLLKNSDFADQVILDLSRWEDWSVLDQMVEMFKNSDSNGYVRQPVVSYLTVASEQEGAVGTRAKAAIAELEKLDPDTVKTARSLMAFGALGRARGAATAATAAAKNGDTSTDTKTTATTADATQGFAASAADQKTDTSQIPDPTTFGQAGQGGQNTAGANASPAGNVSKEPVATAAKLPAEAAKTVSAAATSPASGTTPATASQANPLLLAGLPLAAAAVLMGVYWLILRVGAV